MDTMTASARRLVPLLALALLLLLDSPPVAAQLPPAIQADRLLVRAEREIKDGDYAAAAAALEQIMELHAEHGLEVPEAFWFKRGQVAQEAGLYERAIKSVTRYLEVAGQEGEHYAAALELLDAAEQAVEELKAAEQEAGERMQQVERAIQGGDYAAAAAALEQIVKLQAEHRLEIPAAFWFRWAQFAQEAGYYQSAMESAARYLEYAGEEAEHYSAALELLDAAKDAKEFAEAWDLPFQECGRCPEMVAIPVGSFRMGCVSGLDCNDDELPVHTVTISQPFALSKREVTFAQWDACAATGGCGGHRPDDQGWGRGDRPVINVSWRDAQSYVSWLSHETGEAYRLPTEAEWEYTARARSATKYSWGDNIGRNRANCDGCASRWDDESTAPVGSFSANAFGLQDMHGNVWEWVEDCWNNSYSGAPSDGSAWLSGDCSRRVLRGGSLADDPRFLRSASRSGYTSGDRSLINGGFRVARTLPR